MPSSRTISGEGWAAIVGAVGSAFLLAKKLVGARPAPKPDLLTRADFYAEMLAMRDRNDAAHLALLEEREAIQGELLAALDRQVTRINALEARFARLDERTRN
jgi:hypothetical protein